MNFFNFESKILNLFTRNFFPHLLNSEFWLLVFMLCSFWPKGNFLLQPLHNTATLLPEAVGCPAGQRLKAFSSGAGREGNDCA
jgi:hypothetical protein